jgi:hypothetical protein
MNNCIETSGLFLLDSSFDKSKFKDLDISNLHIITFDYESHQFLNEKKIEHEISEKYISELELHNIQKLSFHYSEWYNEERINELLTFDELNLGQTIKQEFHFFLISNFLKKFVEISNLQELIQNKKILTTVTLFDIVNHFSNNIEVVDNDIEIQTFLHDRIQYNFNNLLKINISKKSFQNIKKNLDNLTSLIISNKQDPQFTNSLLIEFDPIKFEILLKNSNKHNIFFTIFNMRKPTIWNLNSFKIMKNTKTNFININNFKNSNNQNLKKLKNNIETLEKNSIINKKLETFFSINGISFWYIIKTMFIKLISDRLVDAITYSENTKNILTNQKFSNIIIQNEIGFHEQIILHYSKLFKIPVILLQHGIHNDDDNSFEFNLSAGVIPQKSNFHLCWNDNFSKYLQHNNIPTSKIRVLGNPAYDKLYHKRKILKNEYILLAVSSPRLHHITGLQNEKIDFFYSCIEKICKIILSYNKKLIIKLHPGSDERDITEFVKKIDDSISIQKFNDIAPLIQNCEIFVSLGVSSTILEAQLLSKPVISIQTNYDVWGTPSLIKNNNCIQTPMTTFNEIFQKILTDDSSKKQLIQSGKKNSDEYLANFGNSSKLILDFLSDLK